GALHAHDLSLRQLSRRRGPVLAAVRAAGGAAGAGTRGGRGLRLPGRLPGLRRADPGTGGGCDADAARACAEGARSIGGGVSALAKKIARLRGEAGVGSTPRLAPICPSGIFPRAAGEVPAQRGMGATTPEDSHQATIDHLRSLLKIRAPAAAAPRSIDRALPGEEISPGLRYHEQ